MKKIEAGQFYTAISARIDDVQDVLKVCLLMQMFIQRKGLWNKFSEYSKKEMNKWNND